MLILALESTSNIASAALWRDGEMLALSSLNSGNTHSTTLLPLATEMLAKTGLTPADVDLFAAAVGPGSFTGIRIAAATLSGLAFGLDKPVVGVSSLAGLAYSFEGIHGIICPVIGARRSQFYSALFVSDKAGIHRLTDDDVVLADELDRYLAAVEGPVYFTGDGAADAQNAVTPGRVENTPPALLYPSAFSVAKAAFDLYTSTEDKSVFTPERLSPVYLRKTQAEREREERLAAETQ